MLLLIECEPASHASQHAMQVTQLLKANILKWVLRVNSCLSALFEMGA